MTGSDRPMRDVVVRVTDFVARGGSMRSIGSNVSESSDAADGDCGVNKVVPVVVAAASASAAECEGDK